MNVLDTVAMVGVAAIVLYGFYVLIFGRSL